MRSRTSDGDGEGLVRLVDHDGAIIGFVAAQHVGCMCCLRIRVHRLHRQRAAFGENDLAGVGHLCHGPVGVGDCSDVIRQLPMIEFSWLKAGAAVAMASAVRAMLK